MISELSLRVVGADHANDDGSCRRTEIALCEPGDDVTLLVQPDNPVDPNAVKVLSGRGVQIGFLQAERAPWFASMLRRGEEVSAIFQKASPWGATIRANITGARPSLPFRSVGAESRFDSQVEDGWWPDPVYPDE